ncbi:hypothetical protein D9613_012779 [Agrocybe pediades]|uniref:Uncharacterized protein n=1 Tax=Agrocybe pediades TaxID=84607 RepID=A0A8H4VT08_9AGAR|nr:hypothetical protein D9613_012779 [Agrocybe pediades]
MNGLRAVTRFPVSTSTYRSYGESYPSSATLMDMLCKKYPRFTLKCVPMQENGFSWAAFKLISLQRGCGTGLAPFAAANQIQGPLERHSNSSLVLRDAC